MENRCLPLLDGTVGLDINDIADPVVEIVSQRDSIGPSHFDADLTYLNCLR